MPTTPTYRQTSVELSKRDHGIYQDEAGEVTVQLHAPDWSHDAAPEVIKVTVTPPKPAKPEGEGGEARLDFIDRVGVAMAALMVAVPAAVQYGPHLARILG